MVSDNVYRLDIYRKSSVFRKRVKVMFEGSEFYLPEKQMDSIKRMISLEQDKKMLLNNGSLIAVCLNDDLYLSLSLKNEILNFSIITEQSDFLFMVKIHY